jgi:hypothetical protein
MSVMIVLVYYQNEYLELFLNNLFKNNFGNKFNISVIENYSEKTDDFIRPFLKRILFEKKIHRYVLFNENIANSAIQKYLEIYSHEILANKYTIVSDSDLDFDPIKAHNECINILDRHPQNDFCSLRLDFSNLPYKTYENAHQWFPKYQPYCCYLRGHGGIHFSHFRSKNLIDYILNAKNINRPFLDSDMNKFLLSENKSPCITRINTAKHLTWDDYGLVSEYSKLKKLVDNNIWTTMLDSNFEVYE